MPQYSKLEPIRFAIIGTGLIARVIANALAASSRAELVAVASRDIRRAREFAADIPGVVATGSMADLLADARVDAVYVATPTTTKEEIVLAALAAGKHVLVDKPFTDAQAVARMIAAADARQLVLMDASHFVHHPRTHTIRDVLAEQVGNHRSLHAAFHTAFMDPANIRFDTALEPMGALGDMGWYAMRAIVEYLQPAGALAQVSAAVERHAATGAVFRSAGLLAFGGGETATFDVGYAVNTAVMDLRLVGDKGVISMDDFTLDWTNSIAYTNADIATGYVHRAARSTRKTFAFVETPSPVPAQVLMIERFAELAAGGTTAGHMALTDATLRTQQYLDAVWRAVG